MCCFTNVKPKRLQHAQTRWLSTCLVTAISSARQTGNVKHEFRRREEGFTNLKQLLYFLLRHLIWLDY